MVDQLIPVVVDEEQGEGLRLVVQAAQVGNVMVAEPSLTARLGAVSDSIEQVSRKVLDAAKRAGPDKATVELGFSLAVEQGQLLALLGKGKGEASITVTLEWSRSKDE